MDDISQIKKLRSKAGITQKELADRAGVSQSLVAKVEAGKLDPSFSNAMKLFDALRSLESQETTAKDIMNRKILAVSPTDSVKSAIVIMKRHEISQLPVLEGYHAVGYISESIILDHLLKGRHDLCVKDVMEDSPPVIPLDSRKEVVANLLKQFPLVLVKEKARLRGIITKSDLLTNLYD